jgi:acyl carrier protein
MTTTPTSETGRPVPSTDELRDWLTARVAEYLDDPAEIRPDVSLADYGMDSMYALMLCGDIEDHLDVTIDPTVAWDYPTIDGMVGYVRELLGAAP